MSRDPSFTVTILKTAILLTLDNFTRGEKVRGRKKFVKKVLEIIKERADDFSDVTFGITHTGNAEDAEALKQEIIRLFSPKEVLISYMGSTMGTYAGKNGMILSF